jgi:hypothetical protein
MISSVFKKPHCKGIDITMKTITTISGILCLAALIIGVVSTAEHTQPPKDCTDYAKAADALGVKEDALISAVHP